ncbi:MAG: glycosyltransferase family 4 protein [Desulfocucumaceae bacterium]
MKLCIVGSSKKFFSGISAYTIVMANAFREQGHDVSVILLRNLVPLFLYPGKDRVGQGSFPVDFHPDIEVYGSMDWNSPSSWAGAHRFLEKQMPDAIIMHWWTSSVAHMQALIALRKYMKGKKPLIILEMHEVVDPFEEKIFPIRLYSRLGGKALVNLSDVITAHSGEARDAIARTYNIPRSQIHVVPHGPYNVYGIFDRQSARRELNLKGFTVLYFGMIRQYKGVPLLIDSFNSIPPEIAGKMHLIIAGENWGDDPDLLPAINRSPYRDQIIFRPEFIPDQDVSKYFAASDIVVLPYQRSCGSGVVNIAVAQGKPIISSDIDTLKESLYGYKGASFFPVKDTNALCNMIMDAYSTQRLSGTKKYQFTSITWDSITQNYKQIIQGLRLIPE